MITFEQHNNSNTYYAIRWLNLSTNEFDGELEGNFKSVIETLEHLEVVDFEMYDKEFKIVEVKETPISENEIKLWIESNKYNL
jgi:hypothetical protein